MSQPNPPQRREPELPYSEATGNSIPPASESGRGECLQSWKEISAYLERDPRTAQRWEKLENLPVHRHIHSKAGSVYAYTFEIDAWQQSRTKQAALEDGSLPLATATPPIAGPRKRLWVLTAGSLAIVTAGLVYFARMGQRPVVLEPVPLSICR